MLLPAGRTSNEFAVTKAVVRFVLLVAVLLMPLGMVATPAAAHASESATMPMGHCPEQAPGHHSKGGFTECTMACAAALPAVDSQGSNPPLIICEPVLPDNAQGLHGLHPETATPPPKSS